VRRDQTRTKKALHGFVYGVLTVTLEQLSSFPCDITLSKSLSDDDYAARAIMRQKKLASDFRNYMTTGQSFMRVNADRQDFYGKVITAAKTVSFYLPYHFLWPC
jgi:hypothetical protein